LDGGCISAVETPDLPEDRLVLVRILAGIVDQASDGLADVRQAMGRDHLLEKGDLLRLELYRARTWVFHRSLSE
jgi:hypothetical protein